MMWVLYYIVLLVMMYEVSYYIVAGYGVAGWICYILLVMMYELILLYVIGVMVDLLELRVLESLGLFDVILVCCFFLVVVLSLYCWSLGIRWSCWSCWSLGIRWSSWGYCYVLDAFLVYVFDPGGVVIVWGLSWLN